MITQEELIKEFFTSNPNRKIYHAEVVPWLMIEYKKRTGKVFADPDRGIRKLSQTKKDNNEELKKFCASILEVFEEYDINGHIEWKK